MKNKFFKAVLIAVLAVSAFSLSACEQLNFTEKLDLIAPDADYGFSIYNNRYLVIDGAHYTFADLAYDVLKKKDSWSSVYGVKFIDGDLYYFYDYSTGKDSSNKETPIWHSYVALLKTNLLTAETEQIYGLEDVYASTPSSSDLRFCKVEEDVLVFVYNGVISLFNVKTRETLQTVDFYDKDEFVADESKKFDEIRRNEFNDYYYLSDEIIKYAEYNTESKRYVVHNFAINNKPKYYGSVDNVNRFENYVYTYKYIGGKTGTEYYDCYDLTTGNAMDYDFMMDLVEKQKEQQLTGEEWQEEQARLEEEKSKITVNDEIYRVKVRGDRSLEIVNEAGLLVFTIDNDYAMNNNEKFSQLFNVFPWCKGGEHANITFKVFENRLFVCFRILSIIETPNFIFEFDLEANDLKYVTYIYGDFEFYKLAAK